jgi:hypothetical protein
MHTSWQRILEISSRLRQAPPIPPMDLVSGDCFAVARSGKKDFSRKWRGLSSLRMKFLCARKICQRGVNRGAEARRLKASRACRVEERQYLDILRPLPFPGTPENGMDVTQNEKIRQCVPALP